MRSLTEIIEANKHAEEKEKRNEEEDRRDKEQYSKPIIEEDENEINYVNWDYLANLEEDE